MPRLKDMIGNTYGKLKIISRAPNKGKRRTSWNAKCDCGKMTIVATDDLIAKDVLSCGCLRKDLLRIDLKGRTFGRLKVIEIAEMKDKSRSQFWKCLCSCGKNHIVSSQHLRLGCISSCGCLKDNDVSFTEDQTKYFFSNIEKTESCWFWTGNKRKGYGYFFVGKFIRAHRFSFILHKGKIPDDLIICHTCDNPSCVNPEHLYAGTNKDNHNDMIKRGRSNLSRSKRGTYSRVC